MSDVQDYCFGVIKFGWPEDRRPDGVTADEAAAALAEWRRQISSQAALEASIGVSYSPRDPEEARP